MTDASQINDIIRACELKVWNALVAGDQSADAALLADDFLGVYSDGFAGKADHVDQLSAGPSVQSYELSDEHFLTLGTDMVLFSYLATFQRKSRDVEEAMYVSSIWKKTDTGWMNIFSQDTPA